MDFEMTNPAKDQDTSGPPPNHITNAVAYRFLPRSIAPPASTFGAPQNVSTPAIVPAQVNLGTLINGTAPASIPPPTSNFGTLPITSTPATTPAQVLPNLGASTNGGTTPASTSLDDQLASLSTNMGRLRVQMPRGPNYEKNARQRERRAETRAKREKMAAEGIQMEPKPTVPRVKLSQRQRKNRSIKLKKQREREMAMETDP